MYVGKRCAGSIGFLSRLGDTRKGNWKATPFVMWHSKEYAKLSQQRIPSASWFNNTCQKLYEVTAWLGPKETEPGSWRGLVLLSPISATVSTTGKCFRPASLPLGLLQSGKPVFHSTSNYWQLHYSRGTHYQSRKWSHQPVPHMEPPHRTNAPVPELPQCLHSFMQTKIAC